MLTNKSFSDIFTFSRASTATRINASGLIETVAANQPRFDYDPVTLACKGILIEEQRTNLFTESEFRNGVSDAPTRGPLVAASSIAGFAGALSIGYDGVALQTAYKTSGLLTASTPATISAIVKMDDGGAPVFGHATPTNSANDFAFVLGSNPFKPDKTEYLGGGLYRVSATATVGTTNLSSNGVIKYQTNSSRTFKVTAFQLEQASFPTSYIPTTTAQVTRAADVCSINTLSPWYSQTEGAVFCELDFLNVSGGGMAAFSLDDGSESNRYLIYKTSSSPIVNAYSNSQSMAIGSAQSGRVERSCLAFSADSFSGAINGSVFSAAKTQFPSGISRLFVGRSHAGNYLSGHIRKLKYFPKRLTNAQLQALTA